MPYGRKRIAAYEDMKARTLAQTRDDHRLALEQRADPSVRTADAA